MAEKSLPDDVQIWLNHISEYEEKFKKWSGRVEKIEKRYRDDGNQGNQGRSAAGAAHFNILWSNVQTLVPATFAKLPKPDVSRRFRDNDPIGRVASLIIERGLDYELQHYPWYRESLRACVYDRFLGGRGTCWVRYQPNFKATQIGQPEDGVEVTEDVEVEQGEELDYECAPVDYVHHKDFGHTVARTWEEVTGVWRKVYMTRQACIERFGEDIGKRIPLDARPDKDNKKDYSGEAAARALVYEIWDKESGTAKWLSKSLGEFLDERDDPLKLENFFPCPKPLFATLTNDSLVPVPDFTLYQDQANELDILADRIDGLIKALQVKGVYNSEFKELARLFTEGDNNSLIPVAAWNAFSEKQGLKGAIDLVEILPIAQALAEAYKAFEQVKQQVYDITGLSDIVRGSSEASETATAQQIKGQYASMRLKHMQEEVARFATEIMQIVAQILCTQYEPQTLLQIGAVEQLSPEDQQLVPQALELIADKPLRNFRIEIAADTLVQIDELQEKQDRLEFLKANGEFMEKASQMMSQAGAAAPALVPVIMEMWKFGASAFKVGKTLEGAIDQCADKLKEIAANPPPPAPDPQMEKVKADAQARQAEMAADQQSQMMQFKLDQMRAAMEAQNEQRRNEMEAARAQQQAMFDAQIARFEALLDARTKIEVAEIGAKASLDAAQMQAANTATQQ